MSTFHKDLVDGELHVPGYVQEADPGAVGAGMEWFQPSTRRLRRRNGANDAWLDLAVVSGVNLVESYEHTLILTDAGGLVRLSDPSDTVLIVPENATLAFPVGTTVRVEQVDGGPVTISAETSLPVLNSLDGKLVTSGEGAVATLIKVAADEWTVFGDLIS